MPHPWCSVPGWMGPWTTWASEWHPSPWQAGWNEAIFNVPSNSSYSMILNWVQVLSLWFVLLNPTQLCSQGGAVPKYGPTCFSSTVLLCSWGTDILPGSLPFPILMFSWDWIQQFINPLYFYNSCKGCCNHMCVHSCQSELTVSKKTDNAGQF